MFKKIMGLIVVLLIICLLSATAFAEEKIFTNNNGIKIYIQNPDKGSYTFTWKGSITWKEIVLGANSSVSSKGFAQGKGTLEVYKDGKLAYSYKGKMREGREIGKGVMKWANGNTYEGDFADGKRNGKGIFKWAGGDVYEGDFVNGMRSGKGVYKWADGSIYEGEWANSKRHGLGVTKSSNGNIIYEGEWIDGKTVAEYEQQQQERGKKREQLQKEREQLRSDYERLRKDYEYHRDQFKSFESQCYTILSAEILRDYGDTIYLWSNFVKIDNIISGSARYGEQNIKVTNVDRKFIRSHRAGGLEAKTYNEGDRMMNLPHILVGEETATGRLGNQVRVYVFSYVGEEYSRLEKLKDDAYGKMRKVEKEMERIAEELKKV